MAALRRPLSTVTVRAWGIDVHYPTEGGRSERAVLVLDGRLFDVEFDVGDECETIGTERASGSKHILTEVTTIEVQGTTSKP